MGAAVIAIDLGKTHCRAVVDDGAHQTGRVEGEGAPGLAAPDGVALAREAVLPLVERLVDGFGGTASISAIGVGAAGAWSAPVAAAALAAVLHERTELPAAVASDVVTAHAGALSARAGVLLIAGTGAVALGVAEGEARLVDGWGPDLGDFGSGAWLGREAVRAALRARDGLGPRTALSQALARHSAGAPSLIAWTVAPGPVARRLATAAPLVLDLADQGDPVAQGIRDEAAALLARTAAAAAAGDGEDVVLHGGLTAHAGFRTALDAALTRAGLRASAPEGDALRGAALVARALAPLHERQIHRAG